ncbi:ferredoxin-type protein NapF [Shewanella sp. UCD-FRSSP16_17]|uniref:ferredoxin-type protein NapF n=1 Tax=Shewanella sp. UCD-FRSSP16_17 TaxID=1853256 RepID=UPI0007EEF2D9|nr:ferredoxin-type protein NapF [Shewanella sp. UCD-FRSSP16_17]OBT09219.1 ferredoxin-type protein NapF [Shewanella sp. UCD-FRSSP16_17]
MSQSINHSRRNLFRRRKDNAQRPPWVIDSIEFTDECTRCNACIDACETKVLIKGDGGFPEIKFSEDECTFCQQCATVCEEKVFDVSQALPWTIKASINDSCLTYKGVWCQSCKDACDPRAITFKMAVGQIPKPIIDIDACTGCGACVSPCPAQSITVTEPHAKAE